jgi:predicted lipoprotein with Yx(FWY)xxD motif
MSSTTMPGTTKHSRALRSAMAGIGLAAVVGVAAAGIIDSSGGGSSSAVATTGTATLRSQVASVSGQREPILVDQQGLPLYYYAGDSPSASRVIGELARLWPPVTATSARASGLGGTVAEVQDAHGRQVAYNGHLLYTFVSDRTGVVTGQGVQNFFVATPGLSTPAGSTVPPAGRGGGY